MAGIIAIKPIKAKKKVIKKAPTIISNIPATLESTPSLDKTNHKKYIGKCN